MKYVFLAAALTFVCSSFVVILQGTNIISSQQKITSQLALNSAITEAQHILITTPLDNLESISHFPFAKLYKNEDIDWQDSNSPLLFERLLPSAQDEGKSIEKWRNTTALELFKKSVEIQYATDQINADIRLKLITLYIASILMIASAIATALIHNVKRSLNHSAKLKNYNDHLEQKQKEILRSNQIMSSILEDLNQERKKNSSSRLNDQRLALVAKYSDDGLIGLDENANISSWNPKAESLFSKPESSMIQKPLPVLFDDIDGINILNAMDSLDASNPHTTTTVKWIRTDNTLIQYLELSITGLFADEQIIGYSIIVRDVSSRIHEIEQLKLLIEATPNAIIMSDKDGNIIQTNGHAEKSFGYTKHELLSLRIEDLLPAELERKHIELRKNYLVNPQIRRMGSGQALRARKKDHSTIFVEVGLAPVKLNGQWYVISAITDISERVEAQNKLNLTNNTLAKKNNEMEQFVYTVSHDLKAPLVTISAFAKTVKQRLSESNDTTTLHKLDRIIDNAERMECLITDLLAVSRIMNRPITKNTFNLRDAIEEAIDSQEEDLKDCMLNNTIERTIEVFANRQQIVQCFQNLIGNAAKFRHESRGCTISISCRSLVDEIEIAIKDNGIGISENDQKKIFDIFERGDTQTKGNGVGLAIVKSIIEKHNGEISVASTLGKGAEFTISLPLQVNL